MNYGPELLLVGAVVTGRRAAHHGPGSLGANHTDRPATGLVQI